MIIHRIELKRISGHLKELDGLRGLAISLVIFFHLFPYFQLSKLGWVGVDLFFVLSGFLITGILIDTSDTKHYWRNFFIRRILRIFPLYYLTLILFILLAESSDDFRTNPVVNYAYFSENQVWFWLYLSNIKMFIEGEWLPSLIFNPFWSLSIEEQFYIFWPLFIYNLKGRNLAIVIVSLVVGGILVRIFLVTMNYSSLSIYVFTFSRLDAILLGSLISLMVRVEKWRIYLEHSVPVIFVLALSGLLGIAVVNKSFNPYLESLQLYGYTLIAIFFSALLLITISNNKLNIKHVFQNPFLVFMGKYSYALYIFHWPLYLLLNDPLKKILTIYFSNNTVVELGVSFVALIFTILASLFTWNLFEKHFIKLKSVLSK